MHSLRKLPMNLSQIPLACWVRYGVSNSMMPVPLPKNAWHIYDHDRESDTLVLFPMELLHVIVVPSIHWLGILLLQYMLSVAFSIPSKQIYIIEKPPVIYYRKVAQPVVTGLILQESCPILARRTRFFLFWQVSLDDPFTHFTPQF